MITNYGDHDEYDDDDEEEKIVSRACGNLNVLI